MPSPRDVFGPHRFSDEPEEAAMSDLGDALRRLVPRTGHRPEDCCWTDGRVLALAAQVDDLSARLAEAEHYRREAVEEVRAWAARAEKAEAERDAARNSVSVQCAVTRKWVRKHTEAEAELGRSRAYSEFLEHERDKARAQRDEFKGRYGDMWDERDAARAERDAALAKVRRAEALADLWDEVSPHPWSVSYHPEAHEVISGMSVGGSIRAALADDTAQDTNG